LEPALVLVQQKIGQLTCLKILLWQKAVDYFINHGHQTTLLPGLSLGQLQLAECWEQQQVV
jgi:hypothetical protein